MNKLIIFALVAIIVYHLFLKEGFEPQKTNCSLYVIPQLCNRNKTRGCALNPNKVMGDEQDLCICADPSKGCETKENKVKISYDKLLNAYNEYQKDKSQSNRQRWVDAWKEYKAAAKANK